MTKSRVWLSVLMLGQSVFAQELEPIIYSSKQETPPHKMSSSVYSVEQDAIENRGNFRAVDILRQVPGVEVVQTGVVGGTSSVFIRGAESRHTVILIDGVKVYDSTAISRSFNLSQLNTYDIEKVEVLKGAQSVLYGSDAIGGVINIITKKGEGKNRLKGGAGITTEVAAQHTFDVPYGLVYLNGYYQDSEVASDIDDKNLEDLKVNRGVSATTSMQFENLDLDTTFKYTNDYAETDGTNPARDVNGAYGKSLTYFFKQGAKYYLNDSDHIHADLGYTNTDRKYNSGTSFSNYWGSVLRLEGRWLRQLRDGSFIIGVNRNSELYNDDNLAEKQNVQHDIFANRIHEIGDFTVDYGTRLSISEDYGSHLVYSAGVLKEYAQKHTVKASLKTGFQAPSTYQLFGRTSSGLVGNKNVTPEKSIYAESGYEFRQENMIIGATLFRNFIDNRIDFDSTDFNYVNEDGLLIYGIDSFFRMSFDTQSVGVNLGLYNYELSSGKDIAARAKENLTVNYDYQFNDNHSFGGIFTARGERFDSGGDRLGSYHVLDLQYSFNKDDLTLMGIVKNLMDTQYEHFKDYNTQDRGFQLNVEYIY